MGIDIEAMVIYAGGTEIFGTFDIGGLRPVWAKAHEHFPMKGLPEEMLPYRLGVSVRDKHLPDTEIHDGTYVLRSYAEEAVSGGRARWLDEAHNFVLLESAYIPGYSWVDLHEMSDFLACFKEDEFVWTRMAAIYEFMKVLAQDSADKNARFIYWYT